MARPTLARQLGAAVGLLVALALVGVCFRLYRVYAPPREPLPLPAELIALDDPEGQRLLRESSPSADLEPLRRRLRAQIHGSFCGIASAAAALAALGLGPVRQETFFEGLPEGSKGRWDVFFGGVTIDELGVLLRRKGAHARVTHADEESVSGFRATAAAGLARAGDVFLVNYSRPVVGQAGGGHVSPIAAFHAASDRLLVLDTASYRYPFTWVPLEKLHAAMRAVDPESGRARGYVEVGVR